jgi:hypothetical protein
LRLLTEMERARGELGRGPWYYEAHLAEASGVTLDNSAPHARMWMR